MLSFKEWLVEEAKKPKKKKEDKDVKSTGQGVILPFCKGRRSRNVTQPWPTAAWV